MAPHLQVVVAQQQQQPQQQQQQQQQPVQNQQQQHSASTTPQPNNNNNNNNGNGSNNQTQNVAIQQQQQQQQSQNTNNNNTISTAQTYASAALHSGGAGAGAGGPIPQQAVFNQPIHSANLYMPPPSVHQSHGPMIPAMIPAQMPSNVYVNNVTANVNLHGWAHTVPAYISGAASHYIHGDMPPDQANSVMQPMSAMPVTLAPANAIAAAPLNSGNSSGGISGRGSRRGRGRGGNGGSRRGDYQNQRHPPPEGSPAPTQQMQQNQEQLQLSQQQAPPQHLDPQMLAAGPPHAYHPQYAHATPYPAYSAYPAYFTSQNHMIHSSQTAAAQQATGTPLFVSPMIYNAHPVYNYGYIYPPVMNAADYPYMAGEEVPGDDRQNPDGMIPQLWHPQHMYAEDFVIQATDMHGHHAGSEDLNHNASSMTSSETPSMVSPNYAVYDPHIHDIQQEMGGMQIYDDQAQMQAMHPNAQPLDEDLSECGSQVTQTIQMVSSGTIITTTPMQMSNEPQVVHHTHTQQTTHHLMQTTLIPIEQAAPAQQQQNSGAENLIVDNLSNNNVNNETSNLQECESMSSLSETHQQSMENIAHDYQQQQQQQQPQQSVVDISTVDAYNNGSNNKMLMTDANELNENVPNVDAAIVSVQSSPQQQHQQQQTSPQQNISFVQQEQQQQSQQIKQQQQQQQQQYIIQSYHNQQQQQHHHQQQQQQQSHHQQQNAQMQSYHPHQHNQQQTQHQPQQQHQQHQSYTPHHYESRKQPQAYNNQQSRRKYIPDYGNNNNTGGGGGGGYQSQQQSHMNNNIETKSMSWTNSAKKSTASVSVTATPNLSNNKQSGSYSHSTKTYTNQQHHYQHQQHQQQQQQQQQQNHYNQPQVRNYGAMKMPTSPLGTNATLPTLPGGGVPMNAAAVERKNSQVEQPKLNHSNSNISNSSSNSIKANNNGSVGVGVGVGGVSPTATATTSTASITAAPHQFAPHQSHQQQQQQQFAIQQTPTSTATTNDNINNNNNNININNNKQYPGFTQRKPATQTTVATIVAASTNESMTMPPMNLAPPASSNANANTAPTTPSWASLFASNAGTAKSTTNVVSNVSYSSTGTTAAAVAAAAPIAAVNSTAGTGIVPAANAGMPAQAINKNISGIGTNSTAYPPPFSTKKPIAKVAPYEGITPVTPAPPLITPGVLSYSAASAQGLPPPTTKTTVVPKPEPAPIPNRNAANLDEWTQKYADFLTKYKTDLSPISLRPRGLTNPSNYCYINSILQALIGCSPFYNLIRALPKQAVALSEVKTPTVNAMMSFVNNFSTLPSGLRLRTTKGPKGKDEVGTELQCDSAFEPTELYKLWDDSRGEHVEGRQEDAEEFLGYVLNKLNDEMLEVIKLIAKPNAEQNGQNEQSENEDGGDVWQMICNNRNKGSVTRQTDFGRTPLSDIFRGELRSRLQREGEHSTDVIQPFFTLQLNIEKAASVKEALEILVGRDQLEGVTGSKSKQEVVAWQQMTLEKLPVVLILHLKWFDYRSDGCTKILKKVEFPVELKIDAKILASKKYSQKQRAYRLFAVVYHDGKTATKGHYITDVFHTGYGSWLRYDDSSVKPVTENHVLLPRAPRVPYLLYYRRSDTLPPQATVAGGSATFSGGINSAANQSGGRDRDNK